MDESQKSEMFKAIKHGDENDYCMTCVTPSFAGEGNDSSKNEFGMFPGHCYSLLGAHIVKKDGQEIRLLEIRNPHGTGEWLGDWSDEWEGWTEDLRAQLGQVEKKDDGIFHMSFEHFLE